jgi:hypothetical protein
MKKLSVFAVLLFLGACHKTGSLTQSKPIPIAPSAISTILFLQVRATKTGETYSAKVLKKMEVAGVLNRGTRGVQYLENQWLISFLDKKNNLIDQITMHNPLEEHYEVADDKGQFKSVEVKKVEADFFFRVPYNPLIKSLQVEQMLSAENKKKLFSLTF